MSQVHFISFDGIRRSVETQIGENLMRAATDNAVPGIDGDCGGQCACATCHVYVSAPWAERLPTMRTIFWNSPTSAGNLPDWPARSS